MYSLVFHILNTLLTCNSLLATFAGTERWFLFADRGREVHVGVEFHGSTGFLADDRCPAEPFVAADLQQCNSLSKWLVIRLTSSSDNSLSSNLRIDPQFVTNVNSPEHDRFRTDKSTRYTLAYCLGCLHQEHEASKLTPTFFTRHCLSVIRPTQHTSHRSDVLSLL